MSSLPMSPSPADRVGADAILDQSRIVESTAPVLKILNAAPVMAMVLNRQRQIVAANHQLMEFVGATALEEVLGLRPGEVFECRNAEEAPNGCGTSQACGLCGTLGGILSSQAGRANTQVCRMRRLSGQGEECINLEVSATPLSIGGEQFTILFASDIGDRVRGEFLEHGVLPKLLARTSEIEALAAGLSAANAPELRERTAVALAATAAQLASTLHTYSELTLAEAGELRIAPRPASVLEALRQVAAEFQFDEAAQGRQILVSSAAEEAQAIADPGHLRGILRRMLLNALEASPPPSVVTLGCRASGQRAELWVHNDGEMPREVQSQIFQRGFSTKGPGRGFGAYLMKLIAERFLGGTVFFRSSRQEGTTFVLSLPLAPAGELEAAL
ncbi:MAG: sensor histidine kinase [Bryobacteraceae bacterium]